MTTFEEFDELTQPVKTPDGPLLLWATGLGGETGEVVEAWMDVMTFVVATSKVQDIAKKIERDDGRLDVHGRAIDIAELDQRLIKESGNALFYLKEVLKKRGYTLDDASDAQIEAMREMR
jgi:hypothetical protein